jgi:type IV pilus assembly protein PilB
VPPSPINKAFVELVLRHPNFDYAREVTQLLEDFPDGIALLNAIIDQKLLSKDDACRLWADTLGVAYVDPFASVITEEAVAALPLEIARKVKANGPTNSAAPSPSPSPRPTMPTSSGDSARSRKSPSAPSFALPAKSKTPSRSTTPTKKASKTACSAWSARRSSTSPT